MAACISNPWDLFWTGVIATTMTVYPVLILISIGGMDAKIKEHEIFKRKLDDAKSK